MSNMGFHIVSFQPAYQQAARRLILEGLGEHWGFVDEQINTDLEDIARTYAHDTFVVGRLGDELVATGALVNEGPHTKRIVRMSVAKRYRRHGFGHRILDHLLQIAGRDGTRKIVLETTAEWKEVIAFYEAYGFCIDTYANGEAHMSLDLNLNEEGK